MSSEFPVPAAASPLPAYAELHCRSNFSFQIGASHAEELVERAHALGYSALAVTDECSVAGLVRAHGEARKRGLKLIAGAEFVLEDGAPPDAAADTGPDGAAVPAARWRVVALARDRRGWGQLCSFITACRRAAPKGHYRVGWGDLTAARLGGCEILLAPDRLTRSAITMEAIQHRLMLGKGQFGAHFWLAAELLHGLDDDLWLAQLSDASAATGVPLLAAGDVVMHVRSRKLLHDVLTAVRLGAPVAQCGFGLQPNAEAHLRPRLRLAALYPPALLAHTLVAGRCSFSLDELRYQYPMETVLPGTTPAQTLRHHTWEGGISSPCTTSWPGRAARASCARGAARRPIRRCAMRWASPRWTRRALPCCSSASSRRSATSRPTSTSISSTSGARK
jgi:error-prone DNA polymerase